MINNPVLVKNKRERLRDWSSIGFVQGVLITLILAFIAQGVAYLPFFRIMGAMVVAIILGMIWKATLPLPQSTYGGISFSNKTLLRLGIIFLGIRFDFSELVHVRVELWLLIVFNLLFTIVSVYVIARWLKIEIKLAILAACGTAICGAAAIAAIASQIRGKHNDIVIGTAAVAIVGTLFTIVYTLLYPYIGLSPLGYGMYSGATLHEMANVLAAASPAGNQSEDIAVFVKLTRVAFLVPVSIFLGVLFHRIELKNDQQNSRPTLDIPWYIFGFIGLSILHSTGIIPSELGHLIVILSYLLLSMSMVGLGLSINLATMRKLGLKSVVAVLLGSILLSLITYLFMTITTFL